MRELAMLQSKFDLLASMLEAIRGSDSSEDVVDILYKMINCIDYKMYILCSIRDGHECTEFVDQYQTCLSAVKLLRLHLYSTIFSVIYGAHSTQDILNDTWFDFESMIKNANDTVVPFDFETPFVHHLERLIVS